MVSDVAQRASDASEVPDMLKQVVRHWDESEVTLSELFVLQLFLLLLLKLVA